MNTAKSFTTKKGTVLPLLDLRGKDYLQVQWRLVWFLEEHSDWTVETEFLQLTDKFAIAKATIKDPTGRVVRTAHKQESKQGFQDFLEKAETGAIGRALALCGYGTQFAQELEEGERLADSPVPKVGRIPTDSEIHGGGGSWPIHSGGNTDEPPPIADYDDSFPPQYEGDYFIPFGKFKGKSLNEVPLGELTSYAKWLENNALATKKPLSTDAIDFIKRVRG
jgi:hypothetical protein